MKKSLVGGSFPFPFLFLQGSVGFISSAEGRAEGECGFYQCLSR